MLWMLFPSCSITRAEYFATVSLIHLLFAGQQCVLLPAVCITDQPSDEGGLVMLSLLLDQLANNGFLHSRLHVGSRCGKHQ